MYLVYTEFIIVMFLPEGNNGLSLTGFEPKQLAILRLLVWWVNHSTMPPHCICLAVWIIQREIHLFTYVFNFLFWYIILVKYSLMSVDNSPLTWCFYQFDLIYFIKICCQSPYSTNLKVNKIFPCDCSSHTVWMSNKKQFWILRIHNNFYSEKNHLIWKKNFFRYFWCSLWQQSWFWHIALIWKVLPPIRMWWGLCVDKMHRELVPCS